jgi:hypothetical protein
MAEEQTANVPVVTRFVREVIGCNCPDEVFRRIEVQWGGAAISALELQTPAKIGSSGGHSLMPPCCHP